MIWALLCSVLAATPRASSELRDDDGKHSAVLAFDGLLQTAWAESEPGEGEGSWLELRLDSLVQVESISIWPGDMSNGLRSLRESGRPRTITLSISGRGEEVRKQVRLPDVGVEGPQRVDIPIKADAHIVRISVDDAFGGGLRSDLYITEVAINLVKGARPATVARVLSWRESGAGEKAEATDRDEVVALWDTIRGAEFGDRDALSELMDRAGDGAPYMRRKVREVAYGFRVAALPADGTAIDALLKLKDANGIPALERAALRSVGKRQRELQQDVEVFYAYQELLGARRNLPAWGGTGFEPGALRGFGEPMGIEVDLLGQVWVADVGNNRVQRFNERGTFDAQWGPPAEIANDWFHSGRPWYASGAKPGGEVGSFSNPLDLARVPGKIADTILALDAHGRVQKISPEGSVSELYKVPTDEPLSPGVGGEGYLELVKKKLAVVWGNEVFVIDLEGNELGHFELQDGVPSGAVGLPNGHLGLIYGDQLISYSLDSFRHGDILGGSLGEGFEAWDVALDEKGKLWAVTDTGWAIKYKKPGKVDLRVRFSQIDLDVPRFAVRDGVIFVLSGDEIQRHDVLELSAAAGAGLPLPADDL